MRIQDFALSWRWTQESHAKLPSDVLEALEPVAATRARALYELASRAFQTSAAEERSCSSAHEDKARAWLRELPVSGESAVTIVWSPELGISLPWRIFAEYWAEFCYPSSDDAFVF